MHALKKMACTGYVHETTIQIFDFLNFVDIAIAWSAAVYSLLMQLQVGNALTRASDALENIKRTFKIICIHSFSQHPPIPPLALPLLQTPLILIRQTTQ
jgi:hypothetical protein